MLNLTMSVVFLPGDPHRDSHGLEDLCDRKSGRLSLHPAQRDLSKHEVSVIVMPFLSIMLLCLIVTAGATARETRDLSM